MKAVMIIDGRGFDWRHAGYCVALLKLTFGDLGPRHYPGTMCRIYAVNTPSKKLLRVASRFLPPAVKRIIQVVPGDPAAVLRARVEPAQLPALLGGECECDGGCVRLAGGSAHRAGEEAQNRRLAARMTNQQFGEYVAHPVAAAIVWLAVQGFAAAGGGGAMGPAASASLQPVLGLAATMALRLAAGLAVEVAGDVVVMAAAARQGVEMGAVLIRATAAEVFEAACVCCMVATFVLMAS